MNHNAELLVYYNDGDILTKEYINETWDKIFSDSKKTINENYNIRRMNKIKSIKKMSEEFLKKLGVKNIQIVSEQSIGASLYIQFTNGKEIVKDVSTVTSSLLDFTEKLILEHCLPQVRREKLNIIKNNIK